jgi:transketolase
MLVVEPEAAQDYVTLRHQIAQGDRATKVATLARLAREVRRDVVTMIDAAQAGHIGGDLSVTDILVTLFAGVLDVDPKVGIPAAGPYSRH